VFIVGLVVGPVAGILAGDYVLRSLGVRAVWLVLALLVVVLAVASMPFFVPELKFSLAIGLPLGVLLSATPFRTSPFDTGTEVPEA
jgi:hypothetical protein